MDVVKEIWAAHKPELVYCDHENLNMASHILIATPGETPMQHLSNNFAWAIHIPVGATHPETLVTMRLTGLLAAATKVWPVAETLRTKLQELDSAWASDCSTHVVRNKCNLLAFLRWVHSESPALHGAGFTCVQYTNVTPGQPLLIPPDCVYAVSIACRHAADPVWLHACSPVGNADG